MHKLGVRKLVNFWARREIVDNRDGKNFEAHECGQIALGDRAFVSVAELGNAVLVFVSQFPPVRADLADSPALTHMDVVSKGSQLFLNRKEVLKVQLKVFQLLLVSTCLLLVACTLKAPR